MRNWCDSPPPSIPCAAVFTAWDKEQTIRSSGKRGTPRGPSNSGAGRAKWGPTPDSEIWGASGWRTTRYPSSCLRDRQLSSLKHLAGRNVVGVVERDEKNVNIIHAMWLCWLLHHLTLDHYSMDFQDIFLCSYNKCCWLWPSSNSLMTHILCLL